MKKGILIVVAIGIGAALFFVLGRYIAIPTGVPNTNIALQYGILPIFAILFGPLVGMLSGLIGHILIDLTWGSLWWSWIIASAFFGLFIGFYSFKYNKNQQKFNLKDFMIYSLYCFVGHILSWNLIAPLLDFLIYKEPIEKLLAQGFTATFFNALASIIIGGALLSAYSKTVIKENSLRKE